MFGFTPAATNFQRCPLRRAGVALGLLFGVLCAVSGAAHGAIFTVTSNADPGNGGCTAAGIGDGCTLREAIDAANLALTDDLIDFAPGVTGTVGLTAALPALHTNIILQGPGANLLTVRRAQGAPGGGDYRIFTVSNGSTVSISGLTILNGRAAGSFPANVGGGIFNDHSQLTVSNCTLRGNSGSSGGGIYASADEGSASLTLTDCTLSDNIGSGITTFANEGGNVSLTVTGCTLSGNSDSGIFIFTADASFSGVVSNCTLSGNSGISGGGIHHDSRGNGSATLTVQNSTLSNNSASFQGGGIYNSADGISSTSTLTVRNSTLSGNSAPTGGGIHNNAANSGFIAVQLGNTILQTGASGANFVSTGNMGVASITTQGHNLSDDDGGGFLSAPTDQPLTNAKLDPAGLKNHGGPTPTIALLPDSPAIDAGDSLGATTDQRGIARPQPAGGKPDSGAFEVVQPAQSGPTFTVNRLDDENDGVCSTVRCTLREAVDAANAAAGANTVVFAANVRGTLRLTLGQVTITGPTTINGPGARLLQISNQAGPGNRVFEVIGSASPSAMTGLSIRDGVALDTPGGGLFNHATLTLTGCQLNANRAQGSASTSAGGPGGAALGGAIANSGVLTMHRCLLLANSVNAGQGGDNFGPGNLAGGPGGVALGGAIFNDEGARLALNNCTVLVSNATGGAGGDATAQCIPGEFCVANFGGDGGAGSGAVFNRGAMTVTACTFSRNNGIGGAGGTSDINGAPGQGRGGLTQSSSIGSSIVRNTISAVNTGTDGGGADVDGAFTSQGYNLIGSADHSTGFTASGDQTGSDAAPLDARLAVLADNGGPTNTFRLLLGSPAIDQGKAFGLATDQRTESRPFDEVAIANAPGGDGSDIGAYERHPLLSINDVTVTEGPAQGAPAGTTNALFTVHLADSVAQPVSVHYATANGTATAPSDYTGISGTLTFSPGQQNKTIAVPIVGDLLDEANETFKVSLSSAIQAGIDDGLGVGTIIDNDPTPRFFIDDVTVTEGNGGTANAVFHLTLSAASARTVTVTYKTADGTATAPADYGAHPSTTLTFTPGQTSKTITVGVKGDTLDEANETFKVVLQSASFAAIVDDKGVATITDNDPLPTLSISDAPALNEGNVGTHNALFIVTLTGATERTVTVNYTTANGTATAGSDYTAASGTITFNPGQTSKTLPIPVLGDATVEPDESFKVNLSNATFATIADDQGVHTILNDDGASE